MLQACSWTRDASKRPRSNGRNGKVRGINSNKNTPTLPALLTPVFILVASSCIHPFIQTRAMLLLESVAE